MTPSHIKPILVLVGSLLASLTVTSQAQVIQNNQSDNSSPVTYDSSITTSLITAGQSSLANATVDTSALNGTFSAAGINDGLGLTSGNANATYYLVVGGEPVMPNTATFQLTAGYNLTNIQVISGWTDHNLGEQTFQVLLSIGGRAFTSIGIFTNNTSYGTGFTAQGSYLTTLTGGGGVIATNVTGIRFIFMNPDTSNGTNVVGASQAGDGSQGGTLIHDVQVFGTYYTNLPPAIVQVSQSTGSSDTAYDSFIAPNLIRNGQSSLASATADTSALNPTFTAAGLNDGSAAANASKTYYEVTGGAPVMPNAATFQLTAGYNITNIQVISGWTDHNLGEQAFQVLLSIGGGAFTNYGTFTNNTAFGSGGSAKGSYLTTLTSNAGVIASNVTGIQFVFMNPDTSSGASAVGASQSGSSGGTLIHEVQAFGTFYTNLPAAVATFTNVSGSASAFDGLIAPNLIAAGQSSLASAAADTSAQDGTFTAAGLNDGSAAGTVNETYYVAVPGFETIMPNTAIFQLTAGYNITNIQVISGWTDHNLGEQAFQVWVSIGTGPFTSLGTFVNNTPIDLGTPGSWMTTLQGSLGAAIATNVTAIKFVFLNPDTSNGAGSAGASQAGSNGGTVVHEVQVFGSFYTNLPTAIDLTNIVANYQSDGTSATTYDGSIVPNLIQNGQSSLAGATADTSTLNGTFFAAGLNDGLGLASGNADTTYYAVVGSTPAMPNTATFQLTAGYNITNIQVISGWTDHNLGEQAFQVLLSLGGGAFMSIGTFTNNAAVDVGSGGSWMTTLTASSGAIATNVTGIKFIFLNPDTSNGTGVAGASQAGGGSQGGTLIHEVQVFGIQTTAAAVAPTINLSYFSGGNLIIRGTGGTPNAGYTLLTATNLLTPISNWTTNSTGTLGSTGALSNAIPINPVTPTRFFRLRMP